MLFCAFLITGSGMLVLLFGGGTWATMLLLSIGVGCLAAALYSGLTARRIDRLMRTVKRGKGAVLK